MRVKRAEELDEYWDLDPTEYASMNKHTQNMDGDNRILTLEETHPRIPPWRGMHPALELDIDQRLYQFLAESSPAVRGIWEHFREMSLEKDIQLRWHKRRIQLLLDKSNHAEKTKLLQEYFTALLFERVYKNAVRRHEMFEGVKKKSWLDSLEFNKLHREAFEQDLARKRFITKDLWNDPYTFDLTVPNEKKLLTLEKEKAFQDHLSQINFKEDYYMSRKMSAQLFVDSLVQAVDVANGQLFQSRSVKQIKLALESLAKRWATLTKDIQHVADLNIPHINNNSTMKNPVDVENSSRPEGIPQTLHENYPYHTESVGRSMDIHGVLASQDPNIVVKEKKREILVRTYDRFLKTEAIQYVPLDNIYSHEISRGRAYQLELNEKNAKLLERQDGLDNYEHLKNQANYPHKFGEALEGRFSFDVPRTNSEAPQEIELHNLDHGKEMKNLDIHLSDSQSSERVESFQKFHSVVLAGVEYARHSQDPITHPPQDTKPIDTGDPYKSAVTSVEEVNPSPKITKKES